MSWNPIKAVKKLHKSMPGIGSADPKKALANFHNAQPGRGGSMDLIGKVDKDGNIIGPEYDDPFAQTQDFNFLSPMPFMYQNQQMPLMPQTQGTSYNPAFAQSVRGMMPNFAPQQQMQPQTPQMQPQVQAPQQMPMNIREKYMSRFQGGQPRINYLSGRM